MRRAPCRLGAGQSLCSGRFACLPRPPLWSDRSDSEERAVPRHSLPARHGRTATRHCVVTPLPCPGQTSRLRVYTPPTRYPVPCPGLAILAGPRGPCRPCQQETGAGRPVPLSGALSAALCRAKWRQGRTSHVRHGDAGSRAGPLTGHRSVRRERDGGLSSAAFAGLSALAARPQPL